MTKCECCEQDADRLYRVELSKSKCSGAFKVFCDILQDSPSIWICGQCECIIRVMASVGMLTMSRIVASHSETGDIPRFKGGRGSTCLGAIRQAGGVAIGRVEAWQ